MCFPSRYPISITFPRCSPTGKSTLVRSLLNWSVRHGRNPIHVDLDLDANAITVPGCMAATPVEYPSGMLDLTGPGPQAPLVCSHRRRREEKSSLCSIAVSRSSWPRWLQILSTIPIHHSVGILYRTSVHQWKPQPILPRAGFPCRCY